MSPPRAGRKTADPQAVAERLHAAAIRLLRRLRRLDDVTGLSAPRLSVLSVLVFAGPMSLKVLAAAEQVRPPTMTRIVQALERDGLVQRRTDPADRRSVLIEATRAGQARLRAGKRRRVAALARDVAALREPERRILHSAAGIMEGLGARNRTGEA